MRIGVCLSASQSSNCKIRASLRFLRASSSRLACFLVGLHNGGPDVQVFAVVENLGCTFWAASFCAGITISTVPGQHCSQSLRSAASGVCELFLRGCRYGTGFGAYLCPVISRQSFLCHPLWRGFPSHRQPLAGFITLFQVLMAHCLVSDNRLAPPAVAFVVTVDGLAEVT